MKKFPLIAAIVACAALALALVGCGGPKVEPVDLSVGGAHITYPSNWVVIDAQDNDMLGEAVSEAKGVSPAADSETAIALADMTQAGVDLSTMETGLTTLGYDVTKTSLSGCDAIAFTMPVGGVTAQAYVIQAGDRMLMLIGALNPEEDDKVKSQFDEIMASFTYDGDSASGYTSEDGFYPDEQDAADEAQDEADSGE